jgi:hypothetical protein
MFNTSVATALQFLTGRGPASDPSELARILALNDRVRDVLATQLSPDERHTYLLDVPHIIVVGMTSAGKSSLLERLVGMALFPVLDSVCTRRPLQCRVRSAAHIPSTLRFLHAGTTHPDTLRLPQDLATARAVIEREQQLDGFSTQELVAELVVADQDLVVPTFTDLPGLFVVSETRLGANYAENRHHNEVRTQQTRDVLRHYVRQPNTIVLLVVSATDWMHSMNNDPLVGHLAEWLEELQHDEGRTVPVYGVVTKLDTLPHGLSDQSPIHRMLTGTLPSDHVLHGLAVRHWIPVVSSPAVLALGTSDAAHRLEQDCLQRVLGVVPAGHGRAALLTVLQDAVLQRITASYPVLRSQLKHVLAALDAELAQVPPAVADADRSRVLDQLFSAIVAMTQELLGSRGPHRLGTTRSLRTRLLVDAPAALNATLRALSVVTTPLTELGELVALEQGGNFDSEDLFLGAAHALVPLFQPPCLVFVDTVCTLTEAALRVACTTVCGQYTAVAAACLDAVCVPRPSHKVTELLDAFRTMTSIHPFWSHFEAVYEDALQLKPEVAHPPFAADIQDLYRRIRTQTASVHADGPAHARDRVARHCARLEVMGYIIRTTLVAVLVPLVLREVRDGLVDTLGATLRAAVSDTALLVPSTVDHHRRQDLLARRAALAELHGKLL